MDLINDRLSAADTNFQKMIEKGSWEMPPDGHPSKPYRRHERGLLRADGKPGFRTQSGKIELWSTTFENWELDPLPYYDEPPQSPVRTPELYEKYPLIMITGPRSPVYYHSEHRMIPWLREKDPIPYVEIHPDIYGNISDFKQYAADKLMGFPLCAQVDPERYDKAVRFQNGMPMDITLRSEHTAQVAQEEKPVQAVVGPVYNSSD